MDSYNFQKFTQTNSKQVNKITITRSNAFGFPTKFYKEQHIESYKYASLYYDKDKLAIGINFHNNQDDKHKFTIVHNQGGYGGSISVSSFFKANNIDLNKFKGKFTWKTTEIDGGGRLYVIELNENQNSLAQNP